MSKGPRIKRADALKLVRRFREEHFGNFVVAGSLRRRKATVGDVELVAVCATEAERKSVEETLKSLWGTLKTKPDKPKRSGELYGIKFEIHIATPENLGAMLLHTTGSAEWNIVCRVRAKRRGYKLNQYGLWQGDKQVCRANFEYAILQTTGVPYTEPENREVGR